MSIIFHTTGGRYSLKEKRRIKQWLKRVITEENREEGEIDIIITGDKELIQLNTQYLSHTYKTDVLTFNYNEGNTISGDIFISEETIRSNARRYKVTEDEEIRRVILHGILHLVGYNDSSAEERAVMKDMEKKYLSLVG